MDKLKEIAIDIWNNDRKYYLSMLVVGFLLLLIFPFNFFHSEEKEIFHEWKNAALWWSIIFLGTFLAREFSTVWESHSSSSTTTKIRTGIALGIIATIFIAIFLWSYSWKNLEWSVIIPKALIAVYLLIVDIIIIYPDSIPNNKKKPYIKALALDITIVISFVIIAFYCLLKNGFENLYIFAEGACAMSLLISSIVFAVEGLMSTTKSESNG